MYSQQSKLQQQKRQIKSNITTHVQRTIKQLTIYLNNWNGTNNKPTNSNGTNNVSFHLSSQWSAFITKTPPSVLDKHNTKGFPRSTKGLRFTTNYSWSPTLHTIRLIWRM